MSRSAAKKNAKSSGEEKESVKDVIVRLVSIVIMLCYTTVKDTFEILLLLFFLEADMNGSLTKILYT